MKFDPARLSSHAARIGGESALAAASHPDWQIKKRGRWKSLAFLEYIRTALTSMRAAQLTMVNMHAYLLLRRRYASYSPAVAPKDSLT
jgi:hypothetical protein